MIEPSTNLRRYFIIDLRFRIIVALMIDIRSTIKVVIYIKSFTAYFVINPNYSRTKIIIHKCLKT